MFIEKNARWNGQAPTVKLFTALRVDSSLSGYQVGLNLNASYINSRAMFQSNQYVSDV